MAWDGVIGATGSSVDLYPAACDLHQEGRRRRPGGRLEQVLGAASQASTRVQELGPRRMAAGCAPRGLLVGEFGQSSEMTPAGAGRIAAVSVGDALGEGRVPEQAPMGSG